jgi:hypothetical protein
MAVPPLATIQRGRERSPVRVVWCTHATRTAETWHEAPNVLCALQGRTAPRRRES